MNLLVLQNYMRLALGNYPPLQALIGQRIFDRVPRNGDFPYLTLGLAQGIDQTIQCLVNWDAIAEVHVWSRAVGFPEGKAIAVACDDALANRYPVLAGMFTGWFEATGQRWLNDPDGLTTHGVLEYRSRYGPED
jgi:hypothetical protein